MHCSLPSTIEILFGSQADCTLRSLRCKCGALRHSHHASTLSSRTAKQTPNYGMLQVVSYVMSCSGSSAMRPYVATTPLPLRRGMPSNPMWPDAPPICRAGMSLLSSKLSLLWNTDAIPLCCSVLLQLASSACCCPGMGLAVAVSAGTRCSLALLATLPPMLGSLSRGIEGCRCVAVTYTSRAWASQEPTLLRAAFAVGGHLYGMRGFGDAAAW